MTPQDLARLHALAFTNERPWTSAEIAGLVAAPETVLTTRSHAFLLGRVILDEAEILTIATDPGHRRLGLARACLNDFLRQVVQKGARRAYLEVADGNDAALQFYESAGFSQVGRRKKYYKLRDGFHADAIIMAKDLGI